MTKIHWMIRLEEWLWWKLDIRHRWRASISRIECDQQWMNLDLSLKRRGVKY